MLFSLADIVFRRNWLHLQDGCLYISARLHGTTYHNAVPGIFTVATMRSSNFFFLEALV